MHNSIINDNIFLWYNENDETMVTCSIQPSTVETTPTLLNLVSHPITVTLFTQEIHRRFKCGDRVHALNLNWFIDSITTAHPVDGHALEHKVLTLKPLPFNKFKARYISSIFGENDTVIEVIKTHIKNTNIEIAIIEQFESATAPTGDVILISLEEITYLKQNTTTDGKFLALARLKFYAIGESAHTALKNVYKSMRDINDNLSSALEKTLVRNGVKGPGQHITISNPELEEFSMLNDRAPEILLTLSMEFPFIEDGSTTHKIKSIDITINTKIKYLNTIRSYNERVFKPISTD